MKSPAELTALFRDRGLKVTPQRLQVFEVLHGNDSHPTAHAVFQAVRADMPTVSLRTIYQTLSELVGLSELQQVDVGTGAARFDPATDRHHHLVCSRCGEVRDVHQEFGALRLPEFDQQGFSLVGAEVVFRGLCATCSKIPSPQTQTARQEKDRSV